jgi:hypothetical protein
MEPPSGKPGLQTRRKRCAKWLGLEKSIANKGIQVVEMIRGQAGLSAKRAGIPQSLQPAPLAKSSMQAAQFLW